MTYGVPEIDLLYARKKIYFVFCNLVEGFVLAHVTEFSYSRVARWFVSPNVDKLSN